jgi:hypothetical protein
VCRFGAVRREGVVLLLPAGPQVPERVAAEPRRRVRVLEGHRRRQARGHAQAARHQEGARLLRGQGAQGREDQLDHARVPPRRRRPHRPQEEQPQGKHLAGEQGRNVRTNSCQRPKKKKELDDNNVLLSK